MVVWSRPRLAVPLLALFFVGWGDPIRDETGKGIDAYDAKRYDDALAAFQRAEEKASDRPLLSFNVAAALYHLERYQEALSAYDLSKADPSVSAGSLYGAGNVFFRLGKLAEAAELYKEALRRDPSDVDAKHNLELALKTMNESTGKEKDPNRQNQEDGKGEEKPEQPEDQNEETKKPEESATNDSSSASQKEPNEPESPEQKISREQAEQILAALAEEEDQDRRESMQRLRAERKAPAKDW